MLSSILFYTTLYSPAIQVMWLQRSSPRIARRRRTLLQVRGPLLASRFQRLERRLLSGESGYGSELAGMGGMDLHDTVLPSHTSDVAAGELDQSVDRSEDRASDRSERRSLALYL